MTALVKCLKIFKLLNKNNVQDIYIKLDFLVIGIFRIDTNKFMYRYLCIYMYMN